MNRAVEIAETTKIPLTWFVACIWVIGTTGVGFVFWLSTMYSDVAEARSRIQKLERRDEEKSEILHRLDKGLERVQVKMGIDIPSSEKSN